MGFKNNSWAKIWDIKKPEGKRFAEVELSVSKKKDDGYITTFSSKFVRFIGTAFNQIDTIKSGDRIKLSEVDVESWFNKEKGTGGNSFMVYAFEKSDDTNDGANNAPTTSSNFNEVGGDDEDVPF